MLDWLGFYPLPYLQVENISHWDLQTRTELIKRAHICTFESQRNERFSSTLLDDNATQILMFANCVEHSKRVMVPNIKITFTMLATTITWLYLAINSLQFSLSVLQSATKPDVTPALPKIYKPHETIFKKRRTFQIAK